MKQHDLALRLLAKAAQDEVAIDRLIGDVAVPDEFVGSPDSPQGAQEQ